RFVARALEGLRSRGSTPAECSALEDRARELHGAYVRGLFEGSQATRRYPRTAVRAESRVRVLFVLDGGIEALLGPALASVGAHVRALCRELSDRGHHTSVLVLRGEVATSHRPDIRRNDAEGVRVFEGAVADDTDGRAQLARFLRELSPDVVHV